MAPPIHLTGGVGRELGSPVCTAIYAGLVGANTQHEHILLNRPVALILQKENPRPCATKNERISPSLHPPSSGWEGTTRQQASTHMLTYSLPAQSRLPQLSGLRD